MTHVTILKSAGSQNILEEKNTDKIVSCNKSLFAKGIAYITIVQHSKARNISQRNVALLKPSIENDSSERV